MAFAPNAVPIMAQPLQPAPQVHSCQVGAGGRGGRAARGTLHADPMPYASDAAGAVDAHAAGAADAADAAGAADAADAAGAGSNLPGEDPNMWLCRARCRSNAARPAAQESSSCPSPVKPCLSRETSFDSTSAGSVSRMVSEVSEASTEEADSHGSVRGAVWQLCQKQTGCRRVQAALDECGSDQERKALAEELCGHVWEAARCPFGNYVLQRFITLLRPCDCQFVIDEITSHGSRAATQLARHRYGCRIMQRLLEHVRHEQMNSMVETLLREALQLVRHQYGNFVMQRILTHGMPAQQHMLCQLMKPQARDLATDQNASAVLARALAHTSQEDQISLANALLSQPGLLLAMCKTRHGHQTALAMLRALEGDMLVSALDTVKGNLSSLSHFRYGRVVQLVCDWPHSVSPRNGKHL